MVLIIERGRDWFQRAVPGNDKLSTCGLGNSTGGVQVRTTLVWERLNFKNVRNGPSILVVFSKFLPYFLVRKTQKRRKKTRKTVEAFLYEKIMKNAIVAEILINFRFLGESTRIRTKFTIKTSWSLFITEFSDVSVFRRFVLHFPSKVPATTAENATCHWKRLLSSRNTPQKFKQLSGQLHRLMNGQY